MLSMARKTKALVIVVCCLLLVAFVGFVTGFRCQVTFLRKLTGSREIRRIPFVEVPSLEFEKGRQKNLSQKKKRLEPCLDLD
jgi:hypothetical protein